MMISTLEGEGEEEEEGGDKVIDGPYCDPKAKTG